MPTDDREVFRIMVDVLATPQQFAALKNVIGEALCAAPDDHAGPCRVAWSLSSRAGSDAGEEGACLTADDVANIREHLAPVQVWPPDAVNQSLGIVRAVIEQE